MRYCTSCGEKSGHKICKSCGVKENKEHKYCGWCGAPLSEKATVCTKCGYKVKPNLLMSLIGIVFGCILIALATSIFVGMRRYTRGGFDGGTFAVITIFAVSGILCFPFVGRLIKEVLFGKKALTRVALILRLFVVIALLFTNLFVIVYATGKDYVVSEDKAVTAALEAFHKDIKLDNEDSFVLNDSKVTWEDEPYNGEDTLRLIEVELDYSAQNKLGGMVRDTYSVRILFDSTTNGYYPVMDFQRAWDLNS